ncbi:S1 RNA-binding domain-containing protein, partial [Streptococcus pluranimalium]
DNTGVHPESYAAVKELFKQLAIKDLDESAKGKLQALDIVETAEQLGLGEATLNDIIQDLLKPGRDLRDDFEAPVLRQDVLDVKDLKVGQELQGTVRNIVDFGAFVDIGVHEDGLIHISRMVKRKRDAKGRPMAQPHPSDILAVGEIVTVWVTEVDLERNRIGLSLLKPHGLD